MGGWPCWPSPWSSARPAAVEYIRLSPSEFAEDLVKASELAYDQRYEDAIVILRVVVEDEPGDADALSLLGYSLRRLGQLDWAEHFYLKALEQAPEHLGANHISASTTSSAATSRRRGPVSKSSMLCA